METQSTEKTQHTVTLENRKSLTATGIRRIISYDSSAAALDTPLGLLTVGGQDITVSELSVQTGEVRIGGSIEYMQYTSIKERTPLFKRSTR